MNQKRKILVTGGAGFMGSHFIRYWLNKYPDDFVVNFDALTYAANLDNLKDVEQNKKYSFVKGDIRNVGQVKKVMAGVNIVVHFAAETSVDKSIVDPTEFITTNVLGTQILLDQALEQKVERFHHISTDEVFGSLPFDKSKKFTERSPYRPRNPYSASKAGSDHLVRAYHETFGLPVTISNTSNYFGSHQFPEKFIPRLIIRGILGQTLPIYGTGKNVRDWLHVEDHCRALDAILSKGKLGGTYLIGSNSEYSNMEVAKKICDLLGISRQKIEHVPDRPGHDARYALDGAKIRTELKWKPLHDFDHWLKSTVDWYRNNEIWWRKLLDKALMKEQNISQLKKHQLGKQRVKTVLKKYEK
jgi:dTDP-glucose 4,6-dehydratase